MVCRMEEYYEGLASQCCDSHDEFSETQNVDSTLKYMSALAATAAIFFSIKTAGVFNANVL